jgi:ribosomal protein L25 (general stress protein Ctc)
MPTPQELKVTERDTTVTPRQLRAAGYIPATVYGRGVASQSVQVRAHEFTQFFLQGIREFRLTGFMENNVKAQEVQRDPVSQKPVSIQFRVTDEAAAKPASRKSSKSDAKIGQPSKVEPEAETVLSGA